MKQDHAIASMTADQLDAKLKANSGQGSYRMASGSALVSTQATLSRAVSRRRASEQPAGFGKASAEAAQLNSEIKISTNYSVIDDVV